MIVSKKTDSAVASPHGLFGAGLRITGYTEGVNMQGARSLTDLIVPPKVKGAG